MGNADLKVVEHAGPLVPAPFTAEDRRLILDTCCQGASEQEAKVLIGIAQARGLNPLLGDCYFVKRWDSQKGREVWAVQASIDAFRMKAEDTGDYGGQDEPEYEYAQGDEERIVPRLARVRVWRKSVPGRPFAVGVAFWREYVQTKKDGSPTKFWQQSGHNQLAKCAEALALRKAFPRQLSKIYAKEEMDQSNNAIRGESENMEGTAPARIDAEVMDDRPSKGDGAAAPAARASSRSGSANDAAHALGKRIRAIKPGIASDKAKVRAWIESVIGHPYDGETVLSEAEYLLLNNDLDATEMLGDPPTKEGM
jgi:phage recombination protein Bet